jgi:hypothetical protein
MSITIEASNDVTEDSNCGNTCTICLKVLLSQKKKKLDCKHIFCNDCIIKWTKQHPTCPICRQKILPHVPWISAKNKARIKVWMWMVTGISVFILEVFGVVVFFKVISHSFVYPDYQYYVWCLGCGFLAVLIMGILAKTITELI